ncbi:MAG: GH25 family lysozyme [Frankiaceae bacterium]
MSDLHLPDLSEFQTGVDFAALGQATPAVILRAHTGYRADHTFAARLPQARAHMRVRLFYGYCVADRDAATQARELAAIVGPLQPGEAFVCDYETSHGADDSARATAYLNALAGRDILYSGDSFYTAHLTGVKTTGLLLWDAAYRYTEPTTQHFLWQHSDHQPWPGVSSACDCSVFHGTADDLYRLVTPPPAVPFTTLRRGSHGDVVGHLQRDLARVYPGIAVGPQGHYTDLLAAAVARLRHDPSKPPGDIGPGDFDAKAAHKIGWNV